MDLLDILYTPVDTPPRPELDVNKFKAWLAENSPKQKEQVKIFNNSTLIASDKVINYPWDLAMGYCNIFGNGPGWMGNFNTEFPEFSAWLHESFNIPIEKVGVMLFLPVNPTHTGVGFWHNDPDYSGVRHYIAYDDSDQNKLLIRQTKIPYDKRVELMHLPDTAFADEIQECKLLKNDQSFYLNNFRAVHATNTTKIGSTRIACIISPQFTAPHSLTEHCRELIVNSAKKFSDHAILWK